MANDCLTGCVKRAGSCVGARGRTRTEQAASERRASLLSKEISVGERRDECKAFVAERSRSMREQASEIKDKYRVGKSRDVSLLQLHY